MGKMEAAMRLALAYQKAFNHQDTAAMTALMSEECTYDCPSPAPTGTVYTGKEAIQAFWQDFFHSAPQATLKIEDLIGIGERCIMRWQFSPQDSDAREARQRGMDLFRVADGVICEIHSYVKGSI
jgi:predicted SnoaL-like aldol condensation-catalyzing enzyme